MKLNKFISSTLTEIAKGIEDASKKFEKEGSSVIVCPENVETTKENNAVFGLLKEGAEDKHPRVVQAVVFSVAVTVEEGENSGREAGLNVWSIKAGAKKHMEKSNSSVSRIEFTVPMVLSESGSATL